MKHRALRLAAFFLAILVGLSAIIGLVVSVLIGIAAATAAAKIGFVLGGFIITAISAIILLAISRLIYLFVDIEEDLAQIVQAVKTKKGD
jgi:hypothetical protein